MYDAWPCFELNEIAEYILRAVYFGKEVASELCCLSWRHKIRSVLFYRFAQNCDFQDRGAVRVDHRECAVYIASSGGLGADVVCRPGIL